MNQSANLDCALAAEHLRIEETGSEVIVFDTKRQLFHLLNVTAYGILRACNGANSITDIALLLSRQFNVEDLGTLIADVTETLTDFRDKGIVTQIVNESQLQEAAADSTTESPLLAVSVTGSSMFPILLSGDKVLVKKTAPADLAVGDIVVWAHNLRRRIAHRIVAIETAANPPLITTKGDLCLEPDPPVEFDLVLGKVVAVLREKGVQWITELDGKNGSAAAEGAARASGNGAQPALRQKPAYKKMKVLDLREISVESIRNIESVEEISLVLLSPSNVHAWTDIPVRDVQAVFTVPEDYRVYTGQPELLPAMLEFLEAPLRLVVSGQIFLTAFAPDQILAAFEKLILNGQAYVSSAEAKTALESLTEIVSGEICIVPSEHTRWIGQSLLGPEYVAYAAQRPLVAVGELTISKRMQDMPDSLSLFNNSGGKKAAAPKAES